MTVRTEHDRPTRIGSTSWRATSWGGRSLVAVCLMASGSPYASATPPILYSQPANESPVRAEPDDLLLLPGLGFSASDKIVYVQVTNTTASLTPPSLSSVPVVPTAALGFADVASTRDVPYSLTAHLPSAISPDTAYAIWVVDTDGEWSNGTLINDARPLWISPDYGYVTASVANLPRYLKVIGRNLQPQPGSSTQVQLTGPATYTLTASVSDVSLSHYVAQVALPASMTPGTYSVAVSRDGVSWVPLMGENGAAAQTFTVLSDPATLPTVLVDDYSCQAGDDTSCTVAAIAAAANTTVYPNGATVVFAARTYCLCDPGTWGSDTSSKGVDMEGIWVPNFVNLQGAGIGATIVNRGTAWITTQFPPAGQSSRPINSLFNLQGNNIVQGFTFGDENIYSPSYPDSSEALDLGIDANFAKNINLAKPYISHVVITQNEFKLPFIGLVDGGLPVDHLFVTYNTFGAYQNGIYFGPAGNAWPGHTYQMSDTVVAYNTFDPSSYNNPSIGQGVIAGQIGGGLHLDFSNNTADGTNTTYLYSPTDTKGFRAAFFWNTSANNELELVSQNTALCSGDKAGDGEAFVFDSAGPGGFTQAVPVAWASSTASSSVITIDSVPLPLPNQLSYMGYWLQIVQGPGLGQLRKVTGYSATGSTVTLTVSPSFDVLPQVGSQVVLTFDNWQTYIVDNLADHSPGICVDAAKSGNGGGIISFYSNTADSVIEGNQQNSTNGILLAHQYILSSGNPVGLLLDSSNEIRNNNINGAVQFGGVTGVSGIRMAYVATPASGPTPAPPVESFGLVIAGNQITAADDVGGAIEFEDGGSVGYRNSQGGCVASWELADAPLVFHNSLTNELGIGIDDRPPPQVGAGCNPNLTDPIVWHATLYDNTFQNVTDPLQDGSTAAQRFCPASLTTGSSECPAYVQGASSPVTKAQTVTVTYPATQVAGDLNVVAIGWSDSTSQIRSVTDSQGNSYTLAVGPSVSPGNATQAIYYSPNIAAGANAVAVTFNATVAAPDVRIAEYSGVNAVNPVDVVVGAAGSSVFPASGSVTTMNPNDLLVGTNYIAQVNVGPGPGYTQRMITDWSDIVEDQTVSTTGAFAATTIQNPTGWWVMQLVAFKLAGGGDAPSAQGLTAPGGLAVTATSDQGISLSWTASTDNIGVTGYTIERCQGNGCATFTQIGTASGASYTDTGVSASSSYSYRVRAIDVAQLMSGYSNVVSAATP